MIPEEAIVAGAKAMDAYWGGRYAPDEVEELRGEVTAMLEAAAPHMRRIIRGAEELDKLRFQAVVLDAYGTPYVCERHRTDGTRNEWKPAGMGHLDESETILYHGPATVVHEGEPKP